MQQIANRCHVWTKRSSCISKPKQHTFCFRLFYPNEQRLRFFFFFPPLSLPLSPKTPYTTNRRTRNRLAKSQSRHPLTVSTVHRNLETPPDTKLRRLDFFTFKLGPVVASRVCGTGSRCTASQTRALINSSPLSQSHSHFPAQVSVALATDSASG